MKSTVLTILFTTVLVKMLFSKANSETCPKGCRCYDAEIRCKTVIPHWVPQNVREIVLSQVDPKELHPRRFCFVDWRNITILEIQSVQLINDTVLDLKDGTFDCLNELKEFKFRSIYLESFSPQTFTGLKNVQTLDLSGCRRINWDDLFRTLSLGTNFPNLSGLLLSGVATRQTQPLNFNQTYMDALATRPVVHLDLSSTRLTLDFNDSDKLCKNLAYLDLSSSTFELLPLFYKNRICSSLTTVDFSKANFFKSLIRYLSCVNRTIRVDLDFIPFFKTVKNVSLNSIISPSSELQISNCTFIPNVSISTIQFSSNFIPNVDIELVSNSLKSLDLSNDLIETINVRTFKSLSALQRLDLSSNSLFKMASSKNELSNLLKHNQNLKWLSLSNNKMESLPADAFVANVNLESLILSQNTFRQVPSDISPLLNLKILDLRVNSVSSLNSTSRSALDTLYRLQRERNKNDSSPVVTVLLQGNPFLCNCDQIDFILWFSSSPLFASSLDEYFCVSRGQNVTMDQSVEAARQDCEKLRRKHLILLLTVTLIPVASIGMIIALFLLHRRNSKASARQKLVHGVERIRMQDDYFPVFLSYSSDDSDFVRRHILQQMEDHMKVATGLQNRELVCNADVHFDPAHTILSEIFRCLEHCYVFVAVVSTGYCKSRFCQYEIEHAHLLQMPIILIFIEHVDENDMDLITKKVFQTFTRVKFVNNDGEYKVTPDWPQICQSIIQMI